MKLPNLPKPNLKLSIATVAASFLAGSVVAYAGSQNTPTVHMNTQRTADTTPTTSQSDTSTGAADSSSTAPTSDGSTASSSPDSTSSPSAGSSVSSGINTGSTSPSQAQSQEAPAVVAVSATLSDWQAGTLPSNFKPVGSTRSDQYCTWQYSNGTNQQKLYRSNYYAADGTQIADMESNFDCTTAYAPSPS